MTKVEKQLAIAIRALEWIGNFIKDPTVKALTDKTLREIREVTDES